MPNDNDQVVAIKLITQKSEDIIDIGNTYANTNLH